VGHQTKRLQGHKGHSGVRLSARHYAMCMLLKSNNVVVASDAKKRCECEAQRQSERVANAS